MGNIAFVIYVLGRMLPYAITSGMIVTTQYIGNQRNNEYTVWKIQKALLFCISFVANCLLFIGVHYWFYKDIYIVNRVLAIRNLNFYYQEIEYFLISMSLSIVLAIVMGLLIQILLNGGVLTVRARDKKVLLMIMFTFGALIVIGFAFKMENFTDSRIIISEVCACNKSVSLDEKGTVEDYVELYNQGTLPFYLDSYYLSDSTRNLKAKSLKGLVIMPREYLVVPCVDGVNSFGIGNEGETIYLSNEKGYIIQEVSFEKMEEDRAYVKEDILSDEWSFAECSPGKENLKREKVPSPVFLTPAGFYEKEFQLEITSENTIFYTLDGSIPNEFSYVYSQPIRVYDRSEEENRFRSMQNIVEDWENYIPKETAVDKAFLVRAVAVDCEGNKSDIVTATYFINQTEWQDKMVVSLVADPDDLFGDENGIYVTGSIYDTWYQSGQEDGAPTPNFRKTGMEAERAANFELFSNTESLLNQGVGIRIQGASAREKEIKNFSVFARKQYGGADVFMTPIIGEQLEHAVILRNGLADVICQKLMQDRTMAWQKGMAVSLFLNGEYWCDCYLREKYNAQYFWNYYGVEQDNLVLFKSSFLEEGVETDSLLYDELFKKMNTMDFSSDEMYEKIGEVMDIQNYIDYICANIYCANMDVDDSKNVVLWRSREKTDGPYNDGKWRWALYDMDALGWNLPSDYDKESVAAIDSFSQKPRYAETPYNETVIYKALKNNSKFRQQFVVTFMDLLNTTFSTSNVKEVLAEYGLDMGWNKGFFYERPSYMKEYLSKEFELTGDTERVILWNEDESEGTIRINTVAPKMKKGRWTGEYYTDYPVTVTAIPKEGYVFAGWSGSVETQESRLELSLKDGAVELKAIFEKEK